VSNGVWCLLSKRKILLDFQLIALESLLAYSRDPSRARTASLAFGDAALVLDGIVAYAGRDCDFTVQRLVAIRQVCSTENIACVTRTR
jgi:hypothetical protein